MTGSAARAVRFDRYGGRDVLYVGEIPMPVPAADDVWVEVRGAKGGHAGCVARAFARAERRAGMTWPRR